MVETRTRRRVLRIALFLATLGVCLVVLEGGLFLINPIGDRKIRIDPVYLFALIPNSRPVYRRLTADGGGFIRERVNNEGFVGPPLRAPAYRVLAYGDSFIEGYFVHERDTFVRVLEAMWRERTGTDVEVINAGVQGYGPDQILLRMKDDIPRLRPDFVLVSIFAGNDYGDVVRNKLFGLDAAGALQRRYPTLAEDLRASLEEKEPWWERFQIGRHASRMRLVRSAWRRLGRRMGAPVDFEDVVPDVKADVRNLVLSLDECRAYADTAIVTNLLWDRLDSDLVSAPDQACGVKIELMKKILEEMGRELEGLHSAVVLIPSQPTVDASGFPELSREVPHFSPRHPTDLLQQQASAAGLDVINLYDRFLETSGTRSLYLQENHWNEAGQRLAAGIVLDRILGTTSAAQAPSRSR